MKKTKLLIGTIVLSMGLMGTGYAYWSKQLTVTSTVSSANFEVYLSDAEVQQKDKNFNDKYNNVKGEIKGSSNKYGMERKGDKAEYTWTNIYPGSEVTFSYKINSESTIPVKAIPIYTLTNDSNSDLAQALVFNVNGTEYKGFNNFKKAMETEITLLEANRTNTSSKLCKIIVSLPATVEDEKLIEKTFGFTVDMNWKQFNDKSTSSPTPEPTRGPGRS